MSSAIGVAALTNRKEGRTATAQLSGLPTGRLEFWAAEVADGPEFAVPFAPEGERYVLTLPYPNVWAVWAKDDNGFGADFKAVYVGQTDDPDIDALGLYLRALLERNKPLIEAMARTAYPGMKVEQFHYGSATGITKYPAILIYNPRATWDWRATGYLQKWDYSYTTACLFHHQDEQTEIPMATRLLDAVFFIYGRRRYTAFTVQDGLKVTQAQAKAGDVSEVDLGDKLGYVATATCLWTGVAYKQIGGQR